ncbi:MAG: daunorubicin resistance ATP-binding protein DrrA, partial [Acidimicrobiales bacterium]|nr:daunorubicin resistance ATP-binding protein DrrA [Acidimicrobiales bacterium]
RPSTVSPMPDAPTVELLGVSRSFGDNPALRELDLTVPAAKITVLLGPNGAGKTTAIRMITGALNPDAGSVRVFGQDPNADGEEVRRRCGVVSAKPSLYDRLSGFDNLAYAAELYGLGRGDQAAGIIRASAARFGIDHALDQQAGGYSTGMKTRLALARSILHEPDLLLFDEPTSGLDPESSHAVLEMIREMTDEGRTVVMCTHLLLEAEGLADQVVVLEDGTDLIAGTPGELTRRYWPGTVVLIGAEDPESLARATEIPGVRSVEPGSVPGSVRLHLDDERRTPDVVLALAAGGARLTRVEPLQPSLEDLYFAVRTKREVAADGGRQLTSDGITEAVAERQRQVETLTGWRAKDRVTAATATSASNTFTPTTDAAALSAETTSATAPAAGASTTTESVTR